MTTGRFGRALSFDGTNDFVRITDAASLDLTAGMTIEAWIKPDNTGGWRTVILTNARATCPTRSTAPRPARRARS